MDYLSLLFKKDRNERNHATATIFFIFREFDLDHHPRPDFFRDLDWTESHVGN